MRRDNRAFSVSGFGVGCGKAAYASKGVSVNESAQSGILVLSYQLRLLQYGPAVSIRCCESTNSSRTTVTPMQPKELLLGLGAGFSLHSKHEHTCSCNSNEASLPSRSRHMHATPRTRLTAARIPRCSSHRATSRAEVWWESNSICVKN